jgi:hypothetical protein
LPVHFNPGVLIEPRDLLQTLPLSSPPYRQ